MDTVILCAIAAAYLLKILILEKRMSHEGPFLFNRIVVVNGHTQRASLFDLIRRVFGAYHIEEGENYTKWILKTSSLGEVWTCPWCLSFWSSIPFTVAAFINLDYENYFIFVIHLFICFVAAFLYQVSEYVDQ